MITKVSFDFDLGIPIIPDDIKERVRQGEQIDVEILSQTSGYVQNALKWGVAGLWVDGGRIATGESLSRPISTREGASSVNAYNWSNHPNPLRGQYVDNTHGMGRWPANLILDKEAAAMLDAQSGQLKSGDCPNGFKGEYKAEIFGKYEHNLIRPETIYADKGGASRFFYTAKTSPSERNKGCENLYWRKEDRTFVQVNQSEWESLPGRQQAEGNIHPTVKPLALIRYLVRITRTPTGGIVLDPFMGSGTGGIACLYEDRDFIGIDNDVNSLIISNARIESHRQA